MIRAANTGVSAVIDAYGRVLASLDMEQEGVIDHALPPARAATPYARWHDWTLLALLAILAVVLFGRAIARADNRRNDLSSIRNLRFSLHSVRRYVICTPDV